LVKHEFYEPRGKLLKNGRPEPKEFFGLLSDLLRAQVIWVDTSKTGPDAYEHTAQNRRHISNPFEVRIVVDVLRHILTNNAFVEALTNDTKKGEVPIGVISMYKGQVDKIERALAKAEWMGELRPLVKIDTVDSYQGKENRIVLLSLTRNNNEYKQGFLHSPNRLNVAMSRAMDRLIIIGATQMWRDRNQSSPLGTVLRYIVEQAAEGIIEITDARRFRS
jgi:AAA domain